MSINRRLLLASVIVAIIPGVVISLLGSAYLQALSSHGHAVQVSTDAVKVATTQLANLQQMNADLIAFQSENFVASNVNGRPNAGMNQLGQRLNNEIHMLETVWSQTLINYQQNYQIVTSDNMESVRSQLVDDYTLLSIQNEQQITLNLITHQEWQAYLQAQGQELQALKSNQPSAETYQLLIAANDKFAPLEKDWNHVVVLAETVADDVAQAGATYNIYFTVLGTVASLIIFLVVVIIGYMVHLSIARPLHDMVKFTRRISKGDTAARIDIKGNDEIYLVAESMNRMMDNIVQLIQEAQTQHNILQEKVAQMITEVRGIGEGNLQVQPEVMPGTLGLLAVFFNDMIGALSNLIIRVKMDSREVEAAITVSQAMLAQLVETNNRQLQKISEARAEVEQMANSSRLVSERTHMLNDVVHNAQSAFEKGRGSVKQARESMKRIYEHMHETATKLQALDEHSNEINDIVTAISSISQQMRILAHEAALQALVVGEHGKGFAVVAGDIQHLAERTTSQVSSVAQIVRDVHEEIGSATLAIQNTERESSHGTKLVQEASNSLEAIFAAAEIQAQKMDVVNHMTTRQLQPFDAVENVMHLISQSTQQISTSTSSASQSLEYLTRQIAELRISVEAFKLRQPESVFGATARSGPLTRTSQLPQPVRETTPLSDVGSGWTLPQGHNTSPSRHMLDT